MNAENKTSATRRRVAKEFAVLFGFLFLGLAVLPLLIFVVGQAVFGEYGGMGFGDFFGTLSAKVRSGDYVALFLVFSPYLGWQCLRLAAYAWRASGRASGTT